MRRPSSTGWPPPDGSGDPADAESLRPTSRFSSRADAYVRARPDYPSALFQLLSDDLSLESDPIIADVGAGTGILTGQLLARGYRVVAVEPNARMRTHAEAEFGANDRFRSVDGTAEATGLPDDSVDLAIVAQAFHWFNPAPAAIEFRRFLRPDRLTVIVWNIARPCPTSSATPGSRR